MPGDAEPQGGGMAESYAIALRLRAEGATDDAIAEAVGLPREAVANHLRLAEAKRAALVKGREQG